jgi:hypothetical protein
VACQELYAENYATKWTTGSCINKNPGVNKLWLLEAKSLDIVEKLQHSIPRKFYHRTLRRYLKIPIVGFKEFFRLSIPRTPIDVQIGPVELSLTASFLYGKAGI